MTKKQKIWLAISTSLFLIPEILWSPLLNFLYQISQSGKSGGTHPIRENFLTELGESNWLAVIFAIQFVGLLGLFTWFLFSKLRKIIKIPGLILCLSGIIAIIFAFIMFYSFRAWR